MLKVLKKDQTTASEAVGQVGLRHTHKALQMPTAWHLGCSLQEQAAEKERLELERT